MLKSFPFIRKGSKPPPDFPFPSPLNKESSTFGKRGNPCGPPPSPRSITYRAALQCTSDVGPAPTKAPSSTMPVAEPPKPSPTSDLDPSPGSFSSAIPMEKLERNPAHIGTSISSSLTRELSDGGQVLNFCAPEPCLVQSEVNRFLRPEGVSSSPHPTSGITQARDRSCNYTKFPAEMKEHSPYLIVLPIRSSHEPPNSLTLNNFAEESL